MRGERKGRGSAFLPQGNSGLRRDHWGSHWGGRERASDEERERERESCYKPKATRRTRIRTVEHVAHVQVGMEACVAVAGAVEHRQSLEGRQEGRQERR